MPPTLTTVKSLLLSAQLTVAVVAAAPPASRAEDAPRLPAEVRVFNHGAAAPPVAAPTPTPSPTPDPTDEALKQEVLTSLDQVEESLDLIMAKPDGQTEPGFAEDIIERAGLDPKGAVEKAKEVVSGLDTASPEFQEMKKALGKNDSWKTIGEKLTGKKNGDGTRSGGIFTPEVLEHLKTKKPKKKDGDNDLGARFFDERRAGRFGEVASHGRLYLGGAPGAKEARARGGAKGSLNLRGRARREFAAVSYFDHEAGPCPPGTPLGATDVYIAKGVELAAEAFMEGFPTDGLTIAARLAPLAAKTVASAAVLVLEGMNDVSGECHDDNFKGGVDRDLGTLKTDASSIISKLDTEASFTDDAELAALKTGIETHVTNAKTEINNNIFNSKTEIITNDNANRDEMKFLLLRLQIEADLASPDGATAVALFASPVTPQCSAAAAAPVNQCGMLGMVRQIVVQTIARLAGPATAQANSFLAKGDALTNARNYKAAYQQYKMAYKAAAK
ncbi:MAG TPA: hypothetical protein VG148_18875 [Pyrinomonadaceae bacterium]|nr:hypothetical protein [Pyrinomonadaceae bacterium]